MPSEVEYKISFDENSSKFFDREIWVAKTIDFPFYVALIYIEI